MNINTFYPVSYNYSLSAKSNKGMNSQFVLKRDQVSFKANNQKIIDDLANAATDNILNNDMIKNILKDPNKLKVFYGALGSLLVGVAAKITEILTDEIKNTDDDFIPIKTVQDKNTSLQPKKEQQNKTIDFDTTKGRQSLVEQNLKNFIKNNIDNAEYKEQLILLFNAFCAKNRSGYHIVNGVEKSNKDIVVGLLDRLKQIKNQDEIQDIINEYGKYEVSSHDEVILKDPDKPTINIKTIDISEKSQPYLQKYENLKESYVLTLKQAQNADETRQLIDNFLESLGKEGDEQLAKRFLKKVNKDCPELLFELAKTYNNLSLAEKKDFYANFVNDLITQDSVKDWTIYSKDIKLSFPQFNELHKLGIDLPEGYQKISNLLASGAIREFSVQNNNGKYAILLSLSNKSYLSDKIKNLLKFYDVIDPVTLESTDNDEVVTVESLLQDFERNYERHEYTETDYPNLIKYLYGPKHKIYSKDDFYKHRMDYRTDKLLKILNNPQIFKPGLFTIHSKMRFMERFVFTKKNLDYNDLPAVTKTTMQVLINSMNSNLSNNIYITNYQRENVSAPQISVTNANKKIIGDYSCTIDKNGRIHTLYKINK